MVDIRISCVVFFLYMFYYSLAYIHRSENYWVKGYELPNCSPEKEIYGLTSSWSEYTLREFLTLVGI